MSKYLSAPSAFKSLQPWQGGCCNLRRRGTCRPAASLAAQTGRSRLEMSTRARSSPGPCGAAQVSGVGDRMGGAGGEKQASVMRQRAANRGSQKLQRHGCHQRQATRTPRCCRRHGVRGKQARSRRTSSAPCTRQSVMIGTCVALRVPALALWQAAGFKISCTVWHVNTLSQWPSRKCPQQFNPAQKWHCHAVF